MRRGVSRWVVWLALAACGGGPAAASKAPGDAGAPGGDATVADTFVPSACIFNQTGPPQPVIEPLDASVIAVACTGATSAAVVSIRDIAGQGFDWMASVKSAHGFFTPTPQVGSACPGNYGSGFGLDAAGVTVLAPAGARPGDTDDGTLTVITSAPSIGPITEPVHAQVVASSFTVTPTHLDFGTVAVGQNAGIAVTVTNTGGAPLELYPSPTPAPPFSLVTWGTHGEDNFAVPELAPGESGEMLTFYFMPTETGAADMELDLGAFPRQDVTPDCGSPVHVVLHGEGVDPAHDAGVGQ